MKRLLLILPLLTFVSGCALNRAKLYDPDTGKLAAKSLTFTFFDSQSSLAKLHIDTVAVTNRHGSFSPGISISGLNQEASSTNLSQDLGTIIGTALKVYTGRPP